MKLVALAASLFLGIVSSASNAQQALVVSPKDGGEGIQSALQLVRAQRAQGKPNSSDAYTIILEPGDYVLKEPLRFGPQDSGTPEAPLLLVSRVPGEARLVGAAPLAVESVQQGQWWFKPPQLVTPADERAGGDFYLDDSRGVLARHPNFGQHILVEAPMMGRQAGEASKEGFWLRQDVVADLLPKVQQDMDRAIVTVLQSWTTGDHRLAELSPSGRTRVTPAAKWPFLFFGLSQRMHVSNLPNALDAPGEWVLDQGMLKAIPPTRKVPNSTVGRWPRLQTLVQLTGQGGGGARVHDIELRGLGFAFTTRPTSMLGELDMQAAVDVGAAIEVDHADRVAVTHCTVSHTAGYGVWLRAGVRNSLVSHCHMNDLGAGAVKVGESRSASTVNQTSQNTVESNRITHTGRRYPGAVAIWVGRSSGNTVARNVIGYTSYTGISVGWQWNDDASSARDNHVRDNVLFDIGMGQLSDLGGIYTLGRSPGTQITGNFIQRVSDYQGYGAGAWGIYNDEGSAELTVQNNVVVETRSGGYHLHYGRDNLVANNLFALGEDAEIRWSNVGSSGPWRLLGNGVAPRGKVAINVRGGNPIWQSENNELGINAGGSLNVKTFGNPGRVTVQGAKTSNLQSWQAVIKRAQDAIGDVPWSSVKQSTMNGQRRVIELRMDRSEVGLRPVGVIRSYPKQPAEAISLIQDGDGTCLELKDGLRDTARYEPYFFFPVNIQDEPTTVRFSVRPGNNPRILHEWRDDTFGRYNVGPSLAITAAGLEVAGKQLMQLVANNWLDLEVRYPAEGHGNKGKWELRARLVGQAWKSFGPFPVRGPALGTRWAWIGWISDADWATQSCLRDLKIHVG